MHAPCLLAQWVSVMLGEHAPLKLGYFAVKNPSQVRGGATPAPAAAAGHPTCLCTVPSTARRQGE